MIKVVLFLVAIAVACMIRVIAIRFFGVSDDEFRRALYGEQEAEG